MFFRGEKLGNVSSEISFFNLNSVPVEVVKPSSDNKRTNWREFVQDTRMKLPVLLFAARKVRKVAFMNLEIGASSKSVKGFKP